MTNIPRDEDSLDLYPRKLTPRERPRFIFAYYNLWLMLKSNPRGRITHLNQLRHRDLYSLLEMCRFPGSIGKEEIIPPHPHPDASLDSFVYIHEHSRSQSRRNIENLVWYRIRRMYRFFRTNTWKFARDSFLGFRLFWDQRQGVVASHCGVSTMDAVRVWLVEEFDGI